MASITEISVEHIHNAYESIRGNIAVEAFYAVVTGFMAVTLIHRLYTVYREVQSNEDGTPTMKDYMNLVWQYVFCIAAVALFPVLLEALETVFGKLMDDLQAGFGGKVYDVADLFQKPIIAQFEKQFSDMSVMDVAGVLLNPVGSSFDYLLAYVAGVIAAPFYMYAQTLFIVGRYIHHLRLEGHRRRLDHDRTPFGRRKGHFRRSPQLRGQRHGRTAHRPGRLRGRDLFGNLHPDAESAINRSPSKTGTR